jgi:hypothetical protein
MLPLTNFIKLLQRNDLRIRKLATQIVNISPKLLRGITCNWYQFPVPLLCSPQIFSGGLRGCIQKFPDWLSGARTANGTALCHWVQLDRYFVSQSSEFCRNNSLCCFSTRVNCCYCLYRYRFSPETFGYTLVYWLLTVIMGKMKVSFAEYDLKGHNLFCFIMCSFLISCYLFLKVQIRQLSKCIYSPVTQKGDSTKNI